MPATSGKYAHPAWDRCHTRLFCAMVVGVVRRAGNWRYTSNFDVFGHTEHARSQSSSSEDLMTADALPTAALGTTGMEITRVGLGAWAMGGPGWAYSWGAQDDGEAVRTIREAVDVGINWIDTAAVYGLGHSETLVGDALRGIPEADRPFVFTKCGRVWDGADPLAEPRSVSAPASLRQELDASLRRLGVERIDLYQVHQPAQDGTALEEYWATMLGFVSAGKVRAVGLSNHDVGQLAIAEKIGHVDSLQPPFSAIDRAAAADLIPWCQRHDTGTIVYSPMQSGLLTGKYTSTSVAALPADDWRRGSPDFTVDLERNQAVIDAIRTVATRHGATPSAVAVAWVLAWPGVTGAIVGARSPQQIDAWIGAGSLALTRDDLGLIAAAITAADVGTGPAAPPAKG